MLLEIKIDEKCTETRVMIVSSEMNDEVSEIVKKLSAQPSFILAGFRNSEMAILNPDEIIRIYAARQKVYAVTGDGEYTLRLRIYEIEDRLSSSGFLRISSSEIINLKKVQGFDLDYSGTICVNFKNGSTAFASRRYVAKIKQTLGI